MPIPVFDYLPAIPTTGYWEAGTVIFNNAPGAGQPFGWICTVAGSQGTWIQISVEGGTLNTIATTGATIAIGARYNYITSNAAGTYTLPKAASHAPNWVIANYITTASATTFAAQSGEQINGIAAVTAAGSSASFIGDGVSQWYRI